VIGQGVWILWGGSKIAVSHWQSQSSLTQGWRYRAARDVSFDSFPDIKPSNFIYLEDTKGVVESTDNLACVMAIHQNDKAAVHRVCKFNLVTDFIKPGVFAINRCHVFLTNVNGSIRCRTRPTRSVNCSSTCQRKLLSFFIYITRMRGSAIRCVRSQC